MTKTTLKNLFKLVKNKVLTSNAIPLYLFYKLREGQPTPSKAIQAHLQLSGTIINHMNHALEDLGLVEISRGPGRANIPYTFPLSDERLVEILESSTLLSSIYKYRDSRINRYHMKSKTITINKRRTGVFGLKSSELETIVRQLPKDIESFSCTPKHLRQLSKLADEIDIATYAKWFVDKKLGKTVDAFNLGIFLYPGILDEYKAVRARLEKSARYKRISKKKASFEEAANKLEEELNED
jgi:hypothetical protein